MLLIRCLSFSKETTADHLDYNISHLYNESKTLVCPVGVSCLMSHLGITTVQQQLKLINFSVKQTPACPSMSLEFDSILLKHKE